ncbi:hypothetical protein K435DRAFT_140775 [Dendrothele bispora CBS 962.96]|uniref:Uncharacterized protein n=1 Tax=Dendrothele bispora (strain CBS 962.96) TaxID=1314807 RepID=A0A4V4HFI6_DENBC|nr:hypothetical protein K435DRAFT_140775 [Dendrothele bispora CBS 962.96]
MSCHFQLVIYHTPNPDTFSRSSKWVQRLLALLPIYSILYSLQHSPSSTTPNLPSFSSLMACTGLSSRPQQ